ncbi:TPA: hypothetical protein MJB77_16865 [Klebsiella pneumoniae]|uniref:hypothetical protein n=1 Tax=Klebsiella variicola TaxID=244366 RepID=UPI0024A733E8|nr:hypothetical protein [Klebsiella variicola]HBZ0628912.1 hypothetical protein [Klebsiella pneumoniae]WHE63563.1 hypothetical protein QLG20_04005 [Klebsiella variicola]HBW0854211.1 hypothetical protein [Klebsiella variicola]HBW0859318.1 hypothetical protein [Klebsiella variicola]HBW0865213.1 hypothetical protein [Klebsiella variicola]
MDVPITALIGYYYLKCVKVSNKMKTRWLVVSGIAIVLAYGQYKKYEREKFESTPQGMDQIASVESLDLGYPVRSKTGALFFGGFRCRVDCSGHRAGYEWADEYSDVQEDYCWSIDAPISFREGCVSVARELKRAEEENEMDRYSDE